MSSWSAATQGYALLRLSSGEVRMVRAECMATIGAVSNPDQANIKLGKAGRKRWLGKRPSVRGVAMNPIDHPHGRRRGADLGRAASGDALGQADQGRAHAIQQEDGRPNRAAPTQEQETVRGPRWRAQSGKARLSTAIC